MQGPGPDRWHPRPQFLFAKGAGPLFDIGPYYLATLVQLLGPVTSVTAAGHRARASREVMAGPQAGTPFPVEVDTHLSVVTTFVSGVTGTSVYSFDSPVSRQLFEVSGACGALRVPVSGFNEPSGLLSDPEGDWAEVPPDGPVRDRGIGVLEMARAIRAGQQPRASGTLAYHVLDVMLAIEESAASGRPVTVVSSAGQVPPLPADWASDTRTLR
jgi:predicted dehydrogenase